MARYEKIGAVPLDIESRPTARDSLSDLDHHEVLLQTQQLQSQRRIPRRSWMIHAVIILLNIAFFFATSSKLSAHITPEGPAAPYAPAEANIGYRNTAFNFSVFLETKYSGEPTAEKQEAWGEMMSYMGTWVTEEELHKMNRTSVEIPGQGYMAELAVFHQLHCLNYLRKNLYPEHYTIPEEQTVIRQHISHCIDSLRQAIQCQGDLSMVTYSWRDDYHKPWPDFQINKKCRNYDQIKEWAVARNVTKPHEPNPFGNTAKMDSTPPPGREGATELMSGTRLNPKLQHDLQFSMSDSF